MAIIRGTKKILRSDIPDAPGWFDPVMGVLNQFLDTVISALRGRLTFSENFYTDIKTFTFTHGVELEILTRFFTYNGVLILKTPNSSDTDKAITGYLVRQVKTRTLGVTINFAGAGTTTGDVTLAFLG